MGEVILVFMEKVEDEPNAFIVQFEGFPRKFKLGWVCGCLARYRNNAHTKEEKVKALSEAQLTICIHE